MKCRTKPAFVRVATQLAGIKPEVAQESFRNLYFSEIIDVKAITAAAKLGPRFGYTQIGRCPTRWRPLSILGR